MFISKSRHLIRAMTLVLSLIGIKSSCLF